MARNFLFLGLIFAVICTVVDRSSVNGKGDGSGRRFMAVREFRDWRADRNTAGEVTYVSPVLDAGTSWNNLVVSWNADPRPTGYLDIQVQATYPDHETKWFTMGQWSEAPTVYPRQSVNGQKDADGDVETDTLVLNRAATRVRIRVTSGGASAADRLPPRFLGLSFLDTSAQQAPDRPGKAAWGRCLDVPQHSQLSYEGGKVWCSPTSTSMVIGYWAKRLKKPELDREVPLVAAGVYDAVWPGTGNWPFNTGYAGSLPGMRGYVTRLSGMNEIEQWVRAGVPVVCSVSYRLMYGKENPEAGGHVVVCAGFTRSGDVIINDPWADFAKGDTVRQLIPRGRMIAACAKSHNTVYLIYPAGFKIPRNTSAHWE
jgi:hypothetical protein